MKIVNRNIEALSTKTVVDMWDKIYMSQSPKFITFFDGQSYKLRMIGDFVVTARHYIPPDIKLGDFLTKEELESLVKGNETVYNALCERLFSKMDERLRNVVEKCRIEDNRSLSETKNSLSRFGISEQDIFTIKKLKEIDSLFASSGWSKCYLVNVVIREQTLSGTLGSNHPRNGEVAIFPLTSQILDGMLNSARALHGEKAISMKLSGANAHDLHISRTPVNDRPRTLQPYAATRPSYTRYNWMVNFSPNPSNLTNPEVSTILKYGVYDIAESIKHINRNTSSKKSGFIYKVYKPTMGKHQNIDGLLLGQDHEDMKAHADLADKNLSNLPEIALSNKSAQGAIGSLEL